jgi:two-component system response regulator HydG
MIILVFARHFLQLTNLELGKTIQDFTPEVENIFRNYIWHGNLRELKNVIKRATLLTDGEYVEAKTLPFEISKLQQTAV